EREHLAGGRQRSARLRVIRLLVLEELPDERRRRLSLRLRHLLLALEDLGARVAARARAAPVEGPVAVLVDAWLAAGPRRRATTPGCLLLVVVLALPGRRIRAEPVVLDPLLGDDRAVRVHLRNDPDLRALQERGDLRVLPVPVDEQREEAPVHFVGR